MFSWLKGPGSAFKDPLPGSTNYISAYDAGGRLIRDKGGRKPNDSGAKLDDEWGEIAETETGVGGRDGSEESKTMNLAGGRPIPLEEAEDLMPFPKNSAFRSEAVLSEDLKDEIYKRVVEDKVSVRRVSADLLVDMRRVGAVVRLKAVEKEWEKQVRACCKRYSRKTKG